MNDIIFADEKSLSFESNDFTFDHLFLPDVTQEKTYILTARSLLDDVINGYNGTIFVYGQSGSGKTHTMLGPDLVIESITSGIQHGVKIDDEI